MKRNERNYSDEERFAMYTTWNAYDIIKAGAGYAVILFFLRAGTSARLYDVLGYLFGGMLLIAFVAFALAVAEIRQETGR